MADAVFTVSEINEYVRMLLDSDPRLRRVWLRGEISNFTNHYKTGHFYFSLKDEQSSLRAVMFRGNNSRLTFVPENGMRVLLCGDIRAYPRDGQTQIVVSEMQPDGAGSLALAFEQLRRKLEAEGLFDVARKKPLVKYPRRIGVITSPTGAAIHDIIRITSRRYPLCELILFPALVQGSGAAASLCVGVEFFNSVDLVDEIIIGRGGGSVEDLWAFNDERLARTIAASRLPVISAVGHESDVTICDFVADYRAPTPSGAAEIAVPDKAELYAVLNGMETRLQRVTDQYLTRAKEALSRRGDHRLLTSPQAMFDERRMHLCMREERLMHISSAAVERARGAMATRATKLESLSPLAVLSRGYAMVSDADGHLKSSATSLRMGQAVRLRFADGCAMADITSVEGNQQKSKGDG
jgi:exodeoxyribonuclease VII large subunit